MKTWTARGYAAIAVDLEGQIPKRDESKKAWIRTDNLGHAWGGGPARHGNAFGDCFERPFTEQWPYRAVADTLLAFSLLAARPEVDPARIGPGRFRSLPSVGCKNGRHRRHGRATSAG